jgi:hypothetical protein
MLPELLNLKALPVTKTEDTCSHTKIGHLLFSDFSNGRMALIIILRSLSLLICMPICDRVPSAAEGRAMNPNYQPV